MDRKTRDLNSRTAIASKISSLFCSLEPSTYHEVASKVEFWTEYAFTEHWVTVDELVEKVSSLAWLKHSSHASVARFLMEFRDAPHRSDPAKSFVDELCPYVLRWFAAASAENLSVQSNSSSNPYNGSRVAAWGGEGFIRAASFVGYLIEWGLLGHELVRRHLVKPLIAHHYGDCEDAQKSVRAMAIYQLFAAARNSLLQGLLEPEDVQACFKILETKLSLNGAVGPDVAKLNELREFHSMWLRRKEEEQRDLKGVQEHNGEEGKDTIPVEATAEVGTPPAFIFRNLPGVTVDTPSSALRDAVSHPILGDVESHSDTCTSTPAIVASSPPLSITTLSDFTPTELGEEVEHREGQEATRHDTFYFEDGNVEIVCRGTKFRVHSTIISFASSKLRDILSPPTLLSAPMPEGIPRILISDSTEDFAVLLKMIYMPGFPARNMVPEFTVFAPLLRMTTKYGLSAARAGLVEDLKAAYPAKWEDFEAAEVLGEDVFGSPKPHPNAVLNLFLEQRVRFALPFAAYRAGLGGPSALASDKPGTILPRLTLASIIHGMGEIRRAMTHAAHGIAYIGNLRVCSERACLLNAGINPTERRMEALGRISDVLVKKSEGDVLSSLSLGNLLCTSCAKLMKNGHRDCRRKLVWARLPGLLGWEGWEGV